MKHLLDRYKERIVIEHKDGKCGPCNKLLIKYEVAEEFIKKDGEVSLKDYFTEVDKRWRRTEIFKEVQGMMDRGVPFPDIVKIMWEKGYRV